MQVISINNQYSSAFRRLIAFFIDYITLGIVLNVFFWGAFDWPWDIGFDVGFLYHNAISHIVIILYYAAMESSAKQATLGKMAMGIKVVGASHQPVTFAKALLRNVSKILSGLIMGIGYIMIIFDDQKQGLHDKLAGTFVVKY